MMRLVQELTLDDLLRICDEAVFCEREAKFLSTYAPSFFPPAGAQGSDNIHSILEANQLVYDTIVKLSVSIIRGANMQRLYREKAGILNPLLKVYGLGEVREDTDIVSALVELSEKGFQFLNKTSSGNKCSRITRGSYKGRFSAQVQELRQILGDVPMIVYGSALKRENPSDIDMAAFVEVAGVEMYRAMAAGYDLQRKPLLSCVIVPMRFISGYALSDPNTTLYPGRSVVVNGMITFPMGTEEYVQQIRIHNAALSYIQARTTLTTTGLAECEGILPRMNARLKLSKFFQSRLNLDFPSKPIAQYDTVPRVEEFCLAMAVQNMEMKKMLECYLDFAK